MNKGMLSTTATGRPSFIRHLIGLYRGDAMFRGVVDFTVIGGIVILFLQLYPTKGGKPPEQATAPRTTSAPATKTPQATGPASQGTTEKAEVKKPASAPTLVAILFPSPVSNSTIGFTRIFNIDQTAFRNSAPADQPRLSAALRAARAQQFADITGIMADANAADPNVAFMRGIASITAGTADGNKAAEQSWRSAADAGHREAALELARIAIYAPPGTTKNIDQGRRVIETAAVAGDRHAQRLAGIAHLSGQFPLNPAKGRDYLRQAAQAGDVEAMLFYSFTLGWAIGGPADQGAAEDFLRRAATGGLTVAQETLGTFLLNEYKQKVIDDPREGVEWLEKAAKSGYSLSALRTLALFYGAQTEAAEKSKAYELARLCSGIRDVWCQAENGWVFQFGIGTKRDFVKGFAYDQVSHELGNTAAAKPLEAMSRQINAGDKAAALELSQKIRAVLKPIPTIWDMQYVGVAPPASRWAIADLEAAAAPQIQRAAVPQTCTHVAYRQFADLCNNCTAPPWSGTISRTSGDDWTANFVDGHNKSGTSRWRMTSQTNTEINLHDASRNLFTRFDLTARKGFQRRGTTGDWAATSDILSADCH